MLNNTPVAYESHSNLRMYLRCSRMHCLFCTGLLQGVLYYYFVLEEKHKVDDGEKEKKKEDGKEGGARNLWVSGLSGDTRAKDLKQLCSKHGKVHVLSP